MGDFSSDSCILFPIFKDLEISPLLTIVPGKVLKTEKFNIEFYIFSSQSVPASFSGVRKDCNVVNQPYDTDVAVPLGAAMSSGIGRKKAESSKKGEDKLVTPREIHTGCTKLFCQR